MIIHETHFVKSSTRVQDCPPPTLPEYAFIGRSNVGKSSLINSLLNRKALAKVSATPGKTQLINHFLINKNWYIADLPGYGYAKISKTQRKKWETMIRNYMQLRENLQCVFLLIDSRIPPQKKDLDFADSLGEMGLPFVIIFTKIDNKKFADGTNVAAFKQAMLNNWEEMPQYFLTSAEKSLGRNQVLQFIDGVNQNFSLPE